MILITGASGKLGGKVLEHLIESDEALRLLVRDRKRAPEVSGVEIVEGDYSDPSSLKRAFSGVDKAFIVSGHAKPMERAKLHRNVFAAAHESAVDYVVYTSHRSRGLRQMPVSIWLEITTRVRCI
jgi:NAD(P)H dehydrogenase (quinone)